MILSPFLQMKIQIMARKNIENLGFKSLLRKVKIFLSFFSFHFQILHKKRHIFVFNHFWIYCSTNQKQRFQHVLFDFRLIEQDIKKWLKLKIPSFVWRIWKWKNKIFLTFWSGDLNPRFSVIFPPMIWNLMESEEDKIKKASKRDRTLNRNKTCSIKWPFYHCLPTRLSDLPTALQYTARFRGRSLWSRP